MTVTRRSSGSGWWACIGCTAALIASVARGDAPTAPPTPTSCTASMADRTRLHRETERLRRMPRVRDWLRADLVLDQMHNVCDLVVRDCGSCAGELAVRARALAPVCQESIRPIWTAIGLEGDILEGRRELRRLSDEEEGRQYSELVGQYEHQQLLALREQAQMTLRFETQVAALEAARAQAPVADRLQTELSSVALQQVQARLRDLTTQVADSLSPPAPTRRASPRRR